MTVTINVSQNLLSQGVLTIFQFALPAQEWD